VQITEQAIDYRTDSTAMSTSEATSWQLPVAVTRSTRNCFVALPSHVARAARSIGSRSPGDATNSGGGTSAVLCLKLEWDTTDYCEVTGSGGQLISNGSRGDGVSYSGSKNNQSSNGMAFVGWNGMLSGQGASADYLVSGYDSVAGTRSMSGSSSRSSAACGDALELPVALAESLGLPGTLHSRSADSGQKIVVVRCTVLRHSAVRRAKRVEVAPATVDDWEVCFAFAHVLLHICCCSPIRTTAVQYYWLLRKYKIFFEKIVRFCTSQVVEARAGDLEAQLLDQCVVCGVGQTFPIWLDAKRSSEPIRFEVKMQPAYLTLNIAHYAMQFAVLTHFSLPVDTVKTGDQSHASRRAQ